MKVIGGYPDDGRQRDERAENARAIEKMSYADACMRADGFIPNRAGRGCTTGLDNGSFVDPKCYKIAEKP